MFNLITANFFIWQFPGEYLYFHRILVQPTDKNYLNGMWGKLAAEILMQNWDTALEDLNRLLQKYPQIIVIVTDLN